MSTHKSLFIAPPNYNECKPGGPADSSSDEDEKDREKKEADENNSDKEEDEAGQGYAPKYMTYNFK